MGEATVIDRYKPYFCEENIWHLAQRLSGCVLLISNEHKNVAVWHQRLAEEDSQVPDSGSETNQRRPNPVLWDYHVILASELQTNTARPYNWENLAHNTKIYDFDTRLSFPCPIEEYFENSFRPHDPDVPEKFRPQFRILDSKNYVDWFDSDRGHMKNEAGQWCAPPPDWPPIRSHTSDRRSLSELLDFNKEKIAEIQSLKALVQRISP